MSQCDAILAALQSGEHITPLDALQRFGCSRLAARIHELNKSGHGIVMKWKTINGKMFAEYHIPNLVVEIDGNSQYQLPL